MQRPAIERWERNTPQHRPSDIQLEAWARALGLELVLQPVEAAPAAAPSRRRRAA